MGLLSKFSSFNFIYKNAAATFMRFPFTLLSAIFGAIVEILVIESDSQLEKAFFEKFVIVALLGLPLFTALAIYAEKKLWVRLKNYLLQAAGAAFLVVYYFSLPEDLDSPEYHLERFVLLSISFHCLAAFIPFLGGNQINGFWQYNKSLFLRFLTAALYSAVLYLGLTIALASLDLLFGVYVSGDNYFELWVLIASIFNTWFFLAGVPKDLETLNSSTNFPKGLKVFTQFVLLPLIALYFVILITYEFKIIFEWNLPKGWVSQLVLWFSVVGIFSLLLLHPLRDKSENRWIKVFSKWYFRALLPLLGMLFVAIFVRISDYGFTEHRYYVMAMAVGLTLVVFYFIFSKVKDIRVIPMVVFAIAILSAFGPWSAFSVSRASQSNRMETILLDNGMLIDGRIVAAEEELPIRTRRDLSSITRYLTDMHGINSLERWFDDSTLASLDSFGTNTKSKELTLLMGFEFIGKYSGFFDGAFFNLNAVYSAGPLNGYDFLLSLDLAEDQEAVKIEGYEVELLVLREEAKIKLISLDTRDSSESVAEMDMQNSFSALAEKYGDDKVELEDFTFDISNDAFDARLYLRHVAGYDHADSMTISSLIGSVLLRKR